MKAESINILLVEDNPGDARLIAEMLNDLNGQDYNIWHETTLDGSFAAMKQDEFDLILLDLSLPDSYGADTWSNMKERARNIPVILLTGYNNEEFAVGLVKRGAQDYLVKGGIDQKTLVNSVSYALERSKLLKQIHIQLEERIKAENRANEYAAELEKTIKTRDKLFSVIAHDLRSPFSGLLGLTELMCSEFDSFSKEESVKIISTIYNDSKKLFSLVTNLLDWVNLQRERIELHPERIDLNKMMGGIILIYEKEFKKKMIGLTLDIPPKCLAFGDEVTYNTVLRNLFSNAIKFTPVNGQITIAADNSSNQVIISIHNSGSKIPEHIAGKLFNDDTLVSTKGTAGEKGSGLGLMLCKEFVQLNGGKIWFETNDDEGTTFYFTTENYIEEEV
jgi:signal transduction histidine kinase